MEQMKRSFAVLAALLMSISLAACTNLPGGAAIENVDISQTEDTGQSLSSETEVITEVDTEENSQKTEIEQALNLANIKPEWTYSEEDDAWTMAVVTAVTNAELPDYQGVSVCVPGPYVKGVDTDGDGSADVTDSSASGNLVIDYDASMTSTNGQLYTAATARSSSIRGLRDTVPRPIRQREVLTQRKALSISPVETAGSRAPLMTVPLRGMPRPVW